MNDWIEHDGKDSPRLPKATLAIIRMADGWTSRDACPFEEWDWFWCDPFYDIVAYRIVDPT